MGTISFSFIRIFERITTSSPISSYSIVQIVHTIKQTKTLNSDILLLIYWLHRCKHERKSIKIIDIFNNDTTTNNTTTTKQNSRIPMKRFYFNRGRSWVIIMNGKHNTKSGWVKPLI